MQFGQVLAGEKSDENRIQPGHRYARDVGPISRCARKGADNRVALRTALPWGNLRESSWVSCAPVWLPARAPAQFRLWTIPAIPDASVLPAPG